MEMFGGLMMVMSILFFFLAVIWFILPFVILSIKGKVDRSVDQLAAIEQRLASLESRLARLQSPTSTPPLPPATVAGEPESDVSDAPAA